MKAIRFIALVLLWIWLLPVLLLTTLFYPSRQWQDVGAALKDFFRELVELSEASW